MPTFSKYLHAAALLFPRQVDSMWDDPHVPLLVRLRQLATQLCSTAVPAQQPSRRPLLHPAAASRRLEPLLPVTDGTQLHTRVCRWRLRVYPTGSYRTRAGPQHQPPMRRWPTQPMGIPRRADLASQTGHTFPVGQAGCHTLRPLVCCDRCHARVAAAWIGPWHSRL